MVSDTCDEGGSSKQIKHGLTTPIMYLSTGLAHQKDEHRNINESNLHEPLSQITLSDNAMRRKTPTAEMRMDTIKLPRVVNSNQPFSSLDESILDQALSQ
ncbi:hypothetical protein RIF29_19377 [Crotalaria pallida]|uniref:Uncharacterized protein n=1 Tax=Crotalaria pallida TaxID=3830 RepID=A0AAN9IBC8_CROPI